jgi:hypothetical protein
MWAVEARNFGGRADYFYMSGLTQEESRQRHQKLYDEGWAMVRSFNLETEWKGK